MITREQVENLRPGDVVELYDERWPAGTVVRGPLWENNGNLRCGHTTVRWHDTGATQSVHLTLTVIAPGQVSA